MKSIIKFIVSLFLMLVIGVIAGFSLYCAVIGQPIQLFGYGLTHVVSGSMEPAIMTGAYVVYEQVEPGDALSEGNIILFHNADFGNGENVLYCHRIVSISEDGMIATKGDHNEHADPYRTSPNDVVGRTVYVFNGFFGLSPEVSLIILAIAAIAICAVLDSSKFRRRKRLARGSNSDDTPQPCT